MGVLAGSVVHPGGGSFSETVGFRPQWGIFMATSLSSEGAWNGTTVTGAIGAAATQNNAAELLGLVEAGYHEIWDTTAQSVGGVWLGTQPLYLQTSSDAPVDGWTAYISFTANGFDVSSSTTGSAAGKRIYYLLGDEAWEEVAAGIFIPGSGALDLGWLPQAFFGVGYGGGTGNPDHNVGFTDMSLPSVVAGDWGEYDLNQLETNNVYRGILDPNVNIQDWFGNKVAAGTGVILDDQVASGVFFSAAFTAVRTDTTFLGDVVADPGFGNDDARMMNFVLGTVDSIVGSFVPDTSGAPIQYNLPFSPEAVVFFSPQEDRAGVSSQATQGATGWGWCTDQGDQALIVFGGHWNPPNVFQANGFQSSSHCWMANCLDRESPPTGSVGTKVTMGSAIANGEGFEYTTTAHAADPGEVWPVLFWAFAPAVEAPGFFRIVPS